MTVLSKLSGLASLALGAVLAVALQSGAARAEIKKQHIDYKQGEVQLSGLLVYDDAQSGKRPGVLLAHDRAGMAENAFRDFEADRQDGLCGVRRGHIRQSNSPSATLRIPMSLCDHGASGQ